MLDFLQKKIFAILGNLVRRRSRRGWWAYLIWLLPYLLAAAWFAGDVELSLSNQLPLLLPIVLVIVQWIWPTILGWAVIFIPNFLYFCVGASGLIKIIEDCFGSNPDIEGIMLYFIFLGLLLSMCLSLVLALILAVKPKRMPPNKRLKLTR